MAFDNKQIARRHYEEVWSKGNLEAMDQTYDPKFEGKIPMVGKVDLDGMKEAVSLFRKAFPDLRFDVKELMTDGDKVLIHWEATGTSKGPFMGMPPNGRTATVSGFTLMELRNGHVVRDTTEFDALAFLSAMGVEVPTQVVPKPTAQPQPEQVRH